MSEMVERVARALHELGTGPGYEWSNTSNDERRHAERYARAAIKAMREPTKAMNLACSLNISALEAREVWQAMIDAALKDQP